MNNHTRVIDDTTVTSTVTITVKLPGIVYHRDFRAMVHRRYGVPVDDVEVIILRSNPALEALGLTPEIVETLIHHGFTAPSMAPGVQESVLRRQLGDDYAKLYQVNRALAHEGFVLGGRDVSANDVLEHLYFPADWMGVYEYLKQADIDSLTALQSLDFVDAREYSRLAEFMRMAKITPAPLKTDRQLRDVVEQDLIRAGFDVAPLHDVLDQAVSEVTLDGLADALHSVFRDSMARRAFQLIVATLVGFGYRVPKR